MMASSNLINLFKVAPILLGASFITAQAQPVFAQSSNSSSEQDVLQQIENYNNQGSGNSNSLNQVNSVFQLRDVSPDDWAFEALRNLVERYGCIAGYPDGTFRGNQSMTRYEFAAGLNACLQQIERLIASNQGSEVTQEDLQTLKRLTQEFEAELATLGTRVDNLEGRVAVLEDNQFSTTTKLSGTVKFLNPIAFGGNDEDDNEGNLEEVDSNLGFVYDAVLDFEASFTGRDELKVSFQAANFGEFENLGTGTPDTTLEDEEDTGGSFALEDLIYTFPLGNNIKVAFGANDMDVDETWAANFGSGGEINDFTQDNEFALDGADFAFVNAQGGFAGLSNISQTDADGAGISTNINFTDRISLGLGYTTSTDLTNKAEFGLFENYNAGANLNYSGKNFDIGLTYNLLQISQGSSTDLDAQPVDLTQNTIDLHTAFRLGSNVEVGGWVGYLDRQVDVKNSVQTALALPTGSFSTEGWTFGANLSFLDLAKEGSKLGIAFASPPFFDDTEDGQTIEQDRTYIAEVSYDFPVNDNVSITPGVAAIFNPDRNENNDTIYTGLIRTTFSF
ncbi:MAG: iron uptake porin [Halothece sp.]